MLILLSVLTVLISSDMAVNWGLPLGGLLFCFWLLAGGSMSMVYSDKIKEQNEKSIDFMSIFIWWLTIYAWGEICMDYKALIPGYFLVFLLVAFNRLLLKGKSKLNPYWLNRKLMLNGFAAILCPLAVIYILKIFSGNNKRK